MFRSQSRGVRQTPTTEKRSGVDRRRKNQFNMRSLLFGGRRENLRRYEDRQRAFLADQYHQSLFGVIVVILLLSVVDAILTLFLINHGAIEVNPIMAFYIDFGPYTFLSVKYGLTCAGLMILLIFKNLFLQSMRVETGAFLYVILAAFIGVFSWQLFLIQSIIA